MGHLSSASDGPGFELTGCQNRQKRQVPKAVKNLEESTARGCLQTEARFVADPKLLTEHRCDDTLKARIAKGLFSPQLLFFVKGLYTSLGPKYNPGTELIPAASRYVESVQNL